MLHHVHQDVIEGAIADILEGQRTDAVVSPDRDPEYAMI